MNKFPKKIYGLKIIYVLFHMCCYGNFYAQNRTILNKNENFADSLNFLLKSATQDTTRIEILFKLAENKIIDAPEQSLQLLKQAQLLCEKNLNVLGVSNTEILPISRAVYIKKSAKICNT
ncbi:MAG: hypothetical protein H0U95_13605, partial [Bacteroidetes bacterium]|nr:hypothetical protein [Bacteroidota bacterium]